MTYPIFSVIGLEIEYMLVDRDTLAVVPKSDGILHQLAGYQTNAVELGNIAISNELVLHVLELKNNGPACLTLPIEDHFYQTIQQLQPLLNEHHLQLLPTGAHPWMNPHTETKRWPHGDHAIYNQYNAIFNCQGHGWANLQSMHINLPFFGEQEFNQLHNTIRLILPLLPALAASTPILDNKATGFLDTRLQFYAQNQQTIPSIAGHIIPDFIPSPLAYHEQILKPMFKDVEPHDPLGLLQYEWLNSRAAIPKFDYNAIEIRIVDSQECVKADVAIARATHAILKKWLANSTLHLDYPLDTLRLKAIYDQAIKHGPDVLVYDMLVLKHWQLPQRVMTLNQAWGLLLEQVAGDLDKSSQETLAHILSAGNLSQRILKACNNHYDQATLNKVYRKLGDCLLTNECFNP